MGKHTISKEIRKEGREREHIYTVIQCDVCGSKSYERKQRKIEEVLSRQCRNCIANNARESQVQQRLTSDQDRALLEALRSIHRLVPKNDKRMTHGLSGCRTYKIWRGMMHRCYNPKNPAFIFMEEWVFVFVNGGMTSETLLKTWVKRLMGIHWNGMMSMETMNR
jgi:hypothetical protein